VWPALALGIPGHAALRCGLGAAVWASHRAGVEEEGMNVLAQLALLSGAFVVVFLLALVVSQLLALREAQR
jgi:hypothetical protein